MRTMVCDKCGATMVESIFQAVLTCQCGNKKYMGREEDTIKKVKKVDAQ